MRSTFTHDYVFGLDSCENVPKSKTHIRFIEPWFSIGECQRIIQGRQRRIHSAPFGVFWNNGRWGFQTYEFENCSLGSRHPTWSSTD